MATMVRKSKNQTSENNEYVNAINECWQQLYQKHQHDSGALTKETTVVKPETFPLFLSITFLEQQLTR